MNKAICIYDTQKNELWSTNKLNICFILFIINNYFSKKFEIIKMLINYIKQKC